MRDWIHVIAFWFLSIVLADGLANLGQQCEAFLPNAFCSHSVIYKTDAEAIAMSQDYGQLQQSGTKRYWVAYSDRSNNVTYMSPSYASGVYSHLYFNEKVLIAKIQDGFALVYSEPAGQIQYPSISIKAESRGWVPMKNLLLWTTCPANDIGIYEKAILKDHSLFSLESAVNGYGLNLYYVMKWDYIHNRILLSTLHSLKGVSDWVLYGWVDADKCYLWKNSLCLEPNWDKTSMHHLFGEHYPVLKDVKCSKVIPSDRYGDIKNEEISSDSPLMYRLPPYIMRHPIIGISYNRKVGQIYNLLYMDSSTGIPILAYSPAKNNIGLDYWKIVLFLSQDELDNLVQRLEPVNRIAKQNLDDRKGFADAMKAFLRSLVPDISESDLDKKCIEEIMAFIAGLNVSSSALKGLSLIDIQNPKVVSHAQYFDIVSSFARKYRNLQNIKLKGYRYQLNFNNVKYYWIPIEDVPLYAFAEPRVAQLFFS